MGKRSSAVRSAALVLAVVVAGRLLRPWIAGRLPKPSVSDWPLWASGAAWLLFSIYWDLASKKTAAVASSETRGSRRLHLFLANAALILIFLPVPGLRPRYLPESEIVTSAGLLMQSAGLALAIWARRHLGRNWSGEIAIKVDHRLVRSGPYARVRHPIYTALLAMYAGSAVVWGEMHALLGLALAVFAYARKIRLEEANLMQAFTADYREYRKTTWALLPGLF